MRCDKPDVTRDCLLLIGLILFVADLFHPVHGLAVELFLNGDVRHGRGRRRAVPVPLPRRKPDDVARSNLLSWSPLALRPSTPGGDDQRLPERMGVPCGPGTR